MMFNRGFEAFGRCFGDGNGFMHSGWGLLMMGGMVVVAAIVVTVIVVMVKKAHRNNTYGAAPSEAAELLNTRFAKGEITEEEYTRMKKVLGGK